MESNTSNVPKKESVPKELPLDSINLVVQQFKSSFISCEKERVRTKTSQMRY